MRLTLRTLLAFLDRTLEPADHEQLGEKVNSSTVASELAGRIRRVMASSEVGAPAADAAGPTDDANAIAEYLDDTLAPELIADVERQCVASDSQLAEVAAGHQILAITLGEPAEVPAALRRRVYQLAQEKMEGGAGSVEVDESAEKVVEPLHAANAPTVTPVGPADSGVAEATTRLAAERDLNATIAAASKTIRKRNRAERKELAQTTIAGDRTRERLESIGPILSGGRPSRVAPLMVGLGLIAAFLFVISQALEPLRNGKTRNMAREDSTSEQVDPIAQGDTAPTPTPNKGNAENAPSKPSSSPEQNRSSASQSPPTPPVPLTNESSPANPAATDGSRPEEDPVVAENESNDEAVKPANDTSKNDDKPSDNDSPAPPAPASSAGETTAANNTQSRSTGLNPLDAAAQESRVSSVLGVVEEPGGLLMEQSSDNGQWNRIADAVELHSGVVMSCAPTYRARLILDNGIELTLIGPCAIRLDRFAAAQPQQVGPLMLTVDYGRLMMMATKEPAGLILATPAASGRLQLATIGATSSVAIGFQRQPGMNPLEPGVSQCVMDLTSVQARSEWIGRAASQGAASPITLNTGQACRLMEGQPPQIVAQGTASSWVDAAPVDERSPMAIARRELTQIVSGEEPLEASLRSAIGYRNPDVSALAARTLLHLGMADVVFGPEGVLNRADHRYSWPTIVGDVKAFVNRGPMAAALIGAAVGELEGENAGKVWGLLSGFDPDQLKRGGDAALVELMDDPALSVRVVATEALRETMGDTLDYRADFDTPTRRAKILKEIQRLQRRGQVVWSDAQLAQANRPRIDGGEISTHDSGSTSEN